MLDKEYHILVMAALSETGQAGKSVSAHGSKTKSSGATTKAGKIM